MDQKIGVSVIDLEDKLEATITSLGITLPESYYPVFSWEEYRDTVELLVDKGKAKDGGWIIVDRVDLSWSWSQRWYTQQKYNEELSQRLLDVSKQMKRSAMFLPRFDQSGWLVINESYDTVMSKLLYKSKCNIFISGCKCT